MNEITKPKYNSVMIVDDCETDLFITKHMIKKNYFGEEVLSFYSPQEALNYLKDNEIHPSKLPQIIFLDLQMPIMTGFEFMKQYNLLSSSTKENCKVFMISSSCDERDITKAQNDENILGYLEKPLKKQYLENIIAMGSYSFKTLY